MRFKQQKKHTKNTIHTKLSRKYVKKKKTLLNLSLCDVNTPMNTQMIRDSIR